MKIQWLQINVSVRRANERESSICITTIVIIMMDEKWKNHDEKEENKRIAEDTCKRGKKESMPGEKSCKGQ